MSCKPGNLLIIHRTRLCFQGKQNPERNFSGGQSVRLPNISIWHVLFRHMPFLGLKAIDKSLSDDLSSVFVG